MKKRLIAILVGCLLVGVLLFWYDRVRKEASVSYGQKSKTPERLLLSSAGTKSRNADTSNARPNSRISDAEFNVLRVDLPVPKPFPWRGPFYNSENFWSAENANAAREVLPVWIRKAVAAGDLDRAAGYLHSLVGFLKTDSDAHRMETALCLFRLGYKDSAVIDILIAGLESSRYASNVLTPIAGSITERQSVLNHLLFYEDSSLDDHIESVCNKLHGKGGDVEAVLELANYLEAAGRPRTDDYWLGQLESVSGLIHAANALRDRKSVDLVAILRPKVDAEPSSFTAAAATALIYGMTGEQAYEPKLTKLVEEGFQAGHPVATLELALRSLLKGKSLQAETVLKRALTSEALGYQEMALAALAEIPEAGAIQMISNYATPIIGKGLFPSAAFKALIDMGSQQGDAAYDALKQLVLARDGRSEADFDTLEFLKGHRSQLAH